MKANTKTITCIAILLMGVAQGAWAQADTSGQKVKRITFDREQVNIEYTDGTTKKGAATATVVNENVTTGVQDIDKKEWNARRDWYAIDGRTLHAAPRQKGIYVVRETNGVKKIIKKIDGHEIMLFPPARGLSVH